jgi:hypothetical protein
LERARERERTVKAVPLAKPRNAVVRHNNKEGQGKGNFDVFEKLSPDELVGHTPTLNMTPNKPSASRLYEFYSRGLSPTFTASSTRRSPRARS